MSRSSIALLLVGALTLVVAPAGMVHAWQEASEGLWEWYREEAEEHDDEWFYVDDSPVDGGSVSGLVGWTDPAGDVDPAFQNAMVGWGSAPITYGVRVSPGGKYAVVVGFCEGHWGVNADALTGQRVMDIWIEGTQRETIDVVEEAGGNVAYARQYAAEDADGDGWLRVDVVASEEAEDQNSIVNVIWVFEDDSSGEVDMDAVVAGELSDEAHAYIDCGDPFLLW